MHFSFSAQKLKHTVIALSTAASISLASIAVPISAAEFSPNFKGTDMIEFINIVGKNLQKTIIIDPQVRGKVDVRSYDLIDEEAYYQLFLSVLDVHGFAVIDMGNNVLKIVRAKDAKTSAIPVVEEDGTIKGDQFITRVLQLKNSTVRELAPLLRQLTDQAGGGNVVPYEPNNVLLVTSTAAVVERVVKIVNLVDKAGNKEVEIIKLQHASAGEMVRIVESMNKSGGGNKANNTPEYLSPVIVADERTNSVVVSGEAKGREEVVNLIRRLDSELESTGNTRVVYLKYSKADEVSKVLLGVSKTIAEDKQGNQPNNRNQSAGKASIESHKDTNSLIITAEPDMMRSLEAVIRQLDVPRAQVLVEAIIVEVFETDGVQLGVQWFSEKGGFTQFTNGVAPISQAGGAYAASQPKETGSTTTVVDGNVVTTNNPKEKADYTLLAQLLGSVNGMMFGLIDNDWGAIVQAVSSDVNSNILATPSITTLDNEEAYFIVGQEVPIITGSTSSSNNSNPFQTVERQEVGIKLKVTPQVNEGDGVQLTIEQEVSSVSGTTGVDIAINKREIKTTVMAQNGSTVVLGGLIDEDVQESEQKVPLLGDIPILGHLFKSTGSTTRKRNLMVFLKPTIVRDGHLMNELSRGKYNYIRAQEIRKREEGLSLMDDKNLPILPEWNDSLALPPSFDKYMEKRANTTEDNGKAKDN